MAGTPNDVLKTMKDQGIEVVDVRFCDLPGLMQHFSVPAHELSEDVFEDGEKARDRLLVGGVKAKRPTALDQVTHDGEPESPAGIDGDHAPVGHRLDGP